MCTPVPSKPTVCSRTTQTITALTVLMMHRAARCSLRLSTVSHFSLAARSLSQKRSGHVRRSLPQTARPPLRRASLWSHPRRRSRRCRPRALLAGRRQVRRLRPRPMHLRTRHTLRSMAGLRPSPTPRTAASKACKALKAKPSH